MRHPRRSHISSRIHQLVTQNDGAGIETLEIQGRHGKRLFKSAELKIVLCFFLVGAELSRGRDPIEVITAEARNVVFRAFERGWAGPPFDPFALANLLAIETIPTSEVHDARTVPAGGNRFRIEFNPDRPHRRIRYSIFHEIAHTLFPDCALMIRNRGVHKASTGDEWQLETLCNLAAAEFLLPTGALEQIRVFSLSSG